MRLENALLCFYVGKLVKREVNCGKEDSYLSEK